MQANAQLIVAAPDLLDALIEAEKSLATHVKNVIPSIRSVLIRADVKSVRCRVTAGDGLQKVRAAIAKAIG